MIIRHDQTIITITILREKKKFKISIHRSPPSNGGLEGNQKIEKTKTPQRETTKYIFQLTACNPPGMHAFHTQPPSCNLAEPILLYY
jgi:hypothetical protein